MNKILLTAERLNTEFELNDSYSRELNKIGIEFSEDFTTSEFNTVCRRLAVALGYAEKCVDESFAPIADDRYEKNSKKTETDLFKEIGFDDCCTKKDDKFYYCDKCKDADTDGDCDCNDDILNIFNEEPLDEDLYISKELLDKILVVLKHEVNTYNDETAKNLISDIKKIL